MTKQIYITVGNRLTWGLDRSDLETDLEPVDDQGGEGLAVDVLRHDDQRALGLRKQKKSHVISRNIKWGYVSFETFLKSVFQCHREQSFQHGK